MSQILKILKKLTYFIDEIAIFVNSYMLNHFYLFFFFFIVYIHVYMSSE